MMELYENSTDLNFNLDSHTLEFGDMKDIIIFNKNSSNESNSCDGSSGNQRVQANARERFRTHRFEIIKISDTIKKFKNEIFQCKFSIQHFEVVYTH